MPLIFIAVLLYGAIELTQVALPFSAKVYKVSFWTRLHGHPNPKRTIVISDRRLAWQLDRGTLTKGKASYPTTIHYVDKSGKRRLVGHRKNLKKSG